MGGGAIVVAEYGGQCQHAVPRGIIAVFQGHAGILGELGQRDLEVGLSCLNVVRFGLDYG